MRPEPRGSLHQESGQVAMQGENVAAPGGQSDGLSVPSCSPWLHRYAVLTAATTLGLVGIGGLVTSHGAGMSVPDWPTTYGYNMFFFPVSQWVGGIFYEHSHRLVASFVGLLVVGLTRWLGGRHARMPLALIGLGEILAGALLLQFGPQWQGAGHFLSGIGGVVLLAGAVWARNEPAGRPLPFYGWLAFALVQIQGLLGGLRVVLFKDELGIFHATLAQLFFVLLCAIALFTSPWWHRQSIAGSDNRRKLRLDTRSGSGPAFASGFLGSHLAGLFLATTLLVLLQLVVGATMRHQHAGLAIRDFPLAYGRLWPAMDAASVAGYNQQRLEITGVNPITPFQIGLQMAHRFLALLILVAVLFNARTARRVLGRQHLLSKLALGWLGLILAQLFLGAATIWSNKAADIATAHVLAGALSLASGAILCLIASRDAVFGSSQSRTAPDFRLSPLSPEPSAPQA